MNLRKKMLARLPRAGRWYEVRNQAGPDTATIRIYDEIGMWGVTEEDFARDLEQITADTIEVQISSPGGDVFAATAIFNALRTHKARIVTRVDGLAASAASVIVQAGDHRVMLQAAQVMIHEAWGVVVGPAAEMREFADLLEMQNGIIADIYASRAGGDKDEFLELMAAETWFTADEAVEAGLADEVVTPPRKDGDGKAKGGLRDEIVAAFTEDDVRRVLGLPPLQVPPAGEREESNEVALLEAVRDLI